MRQNRQPSEPVAGPPGGIGLTADEMRQADWAPGAERLAIRKVQDVSLAWAGPTAVGGALWARWLVLKGWVPPVFVLGLALAVLVYVMGRLLLLKDVFILVSSYELSLWCRFHAGRRLARKWAYTGRKWRRYGNGNAIREPRKNCGDPNVGPDSRAAAWPSMPHSSSASMTRTASNNS